MKRQSRSFVIAFILAVLLSHSALAQLSSKDMDALEKKLTDASKVSSAARKKLAYRRVIREAEALVKKHASNESKYEALYILFRSQKALVSVDKSATNKKAFMTTAQALQKAPDKYAALRFDADLLISQAEAARKGGDSAARADALRPLVEKYKDTDVEAKVIRVSMILGLEYGNTKLVNDLRDIIAERFPNDLSLIKFQRDKLTTQVFGAPFIATFEKADGTTVLSPMDFTGQTIMFYFWAEKDKDDLKAYAEAWKTVEAEKKIKDEKKQNHVLDGRFRIVSVNMDNLPDCGESILKELGVDWLTLKLPKGKDGDVFKTYVRTGTPKVLTLSPTGYTALHQSGWRSNRPHEQLLGSRTARSWAQPRYCSQLQSTFSAEFLIMDPAGPFDPSAPPEYKAVNSENAKLARTADSVPDEKLKVIQACFIAPPLRYRLTHAESIANYKKADKLCQEAIAAHPDAPELWIVRNRRIAALMGLWKTGDQKAFNAAVDEAAIAIKKGYPKGTDVIARLCLARQELRKAEVKSHQHVNAFINANGGQDASAPALTAAALLALETGNRLLYENLRTSLLAKHASNEMMWTSTAFLLDRYHQYWLFHPPFVAGWTYGRRQNYFLAEGLPETAKRSLSIELKTLEGQTVKVPESKDKWTIIYFVNSTESNRHIREMETIYQARPLKDVNFISAVLDDDAEKARNGLKTKKVKASDAYKTMLVPGGLKNPVVQQLGIIDEDKRHNVVILRPDGSIALSLSGLTMSGMKGSVVKNVLDLQDEFMIDAALKANKLDEAKRLIFALAPVVVPDPNAKKPKKPVKLPVPHLRSRAKVYLAMGELEKAYTDAENAYLAANITGGSISMRTDELDRAEALKAKIQKAIEASKTK